jgi:hypothetical protein
MKKLLVLLFAVSVLGNISAVFADEPSPDTETVSADDGSQSSEGSESLPESSPAE